MLKDYRENKPTITTNRLILRTFIPEDAKDLKEWFGLDAVYKYWGRNATPGEKNPESLFIEKRPWVKRKPSLDFKWAVVFKKNNKVIGELQIFNIQNCRMGEVAYRFHPNYWGMGIATEALQTVVDFIFNNTEIKRLNASADIRNLGSNRVLEKCGFIKEGTIRQGKMLSVYCDYNIYGLLKEDKKKL